MNENLREITHHNVERLLRAIENEREARAVLQLRVDALERHVKGQTADIHEAKTKANAAFGIARNMNGSSTAGV